MKKKELVEIIRLVVKSEVKKAVKSALTEVKKQPEAPISLNEALSQTQEAGDWKSIGTFDSKDARASFAAMQGGGANSGMNSLLSNPAVQKDESLEKAFTRDYSQLVKAMKK
jgi:hypothetical protein|tara:strand:+ start:161 stop:496 length:336 start_codon:yes stop_codon:yes gene_type:complete